MKNMRKVVEMIIPLYAFMIIGLLLFLSLIEPDLIPTVPVMILISLLGCMIILFYVRKEFQRLKREILHGNSLTNLGVVELGILDKSMFDRIIHEITKRQLADILINTSFQNKHMDFFLLSLFQNEELDVKLIVNRILGESENNRNPTFDSILGKCKDVRYTYSNTKNNCIFFGNFVIVFSNSDIANGQVHYMVLNQSNDEYRSLKILYNSLYNAQSNTPITDALVGE